MKEILSIVSSDLKQTKDSESALCQSIFDWREKAREPTRYDITLSLEKAAASLKAASYDLPPASTDQVERYLMRIKAMLDAPKASPDELEKYRTDFKSVLDEREAPQDQADNPAFRFQTEEAKELERQAKKLEREIRDNNAESAVELATFGALHELLESRKGPKPPEAQTLIVYDEDGKESSPTLCKFHLTPRPPVPYPRNHESSQHAYSVRERSLIGTLYSVDNLEKVQSPPDPVFIS